MSIDPSTANPLVDPQSDSRNHDSGFMESMGAPDQESTGAITGVTPFEAGWAIADGIDSGDWKTAVSGMVALGLDVVGAVTDPIAFVASQLFSWMLEHIQPARDALEKLAGNPDMVKGYAASWTNIEQEMTKLGEEYKQTARSETSNWEGQSGEAYRKKAESLAGICDEAAGGAHGIAGLTTGMAEVVNGVRTAVRDLLASIAGSLVSWAIELAASVGTATPIVVGQATTKIAQVVRIVAKLMKALGEAVADATTWLVVLRDLFDGLIRQQSALQESATTG